jgi:predicted O-methyltransferase YrrM
MSSVIETIRRNNGPGTLQTATTWNGAAFVAGMVNLVRPLVAIEVGAHTGSTSAFIIEAIKMNDCGRFIAYEMDIVHAAETKRKLEDLWPGGAWEVKDGDFFKENARGPVNFAFIDIDPKVRYGDAYEDIEFAPGAVIVAHDITLYPDEINPFRARLINEGWSTIVLPWERGFLVAVKP